MKIISHRGYWLSIEEKNTEVAFERSFSTGFGTETDVRDYCGKLVISHDMPNGNEISFPKMLAMMNKIQDIPLTLALNIKADGLANIIKNELVKHPNIDCFVFDMSIPDMRSYLAEGIPVFTRMSEVEMQPAYLEQSAGVWLDGFESVWFDNKTIEKILNNGKRVCIVSPELHKRDQISLWEQIKPLAYRDDLILCTDTPADAVKFFNN